MVEMAQYASRDEWLEARKGLGGSDAGCIMGVNHWKDNLTLWREKMGLAEPEDISAKEVVQYGIRLEPHLRDIFRAHHPDWGVAYRENNMWVNDRIPFAHASLDGWIETDDGKYGVLEIKTAEIQKRAQADAWDGRIPDTYYCQILHYLMVTEFDFAIVCAELQTHRMDGSTEWRIVERRIDRADVERDIAELERQERAFWQNIVDGTEPARLLPGI